MKKILFSALLLAGFVSLGSSAEASCVKRVMVGYDRWGHPVYQDVFVQEYCQPRPNYYYSEASARYSSYDYRRGCDDGRSQYSSHSDSRPRFSVRFGF
jgi:hypothetical protein